MPEDREQRALVPFPPAAANNAGFDSAAEWDRDDIAEPQRHARGDTVGETPEGELVRKQMYLNQLHIPPSQNDAIAWR